MRQGGANPPGSAGCAGRGHSRRLRRFRSCMRRVAGLEDRPGRGSRSSALSLSPTIASCCGSRRPTPSASSLRTSGITGWPWTPFKPAAMCSSRSRSRPICRRPPISWAWPGDVRSRSRWGTSTGFAPAWWKRGAACKRARSGQLRLVTATLARPWLAVQEGSAEELEIRPQGGRWRRAGRRGRPPDRRTLVDHRPGGPGGLRRAETLESGLDVVTAAAIRLRDGTPVTLAVSGVSPGSLFELNYFGERGRIRATDQMLEVDDETGNCRRQIRSARSQPESIDGNFVTALFRGTPLCCPADEALDTVRLIEAIARSAATGQCVRLVDGNSSRPGHTLRTPRPRSIRDRS